MASKMFLQSRLHTQLCAARAEHELLVAVAKCVSGAGEKPSAAAIASAQRQRAKATAELRLALADLRLSRRALNERLKKQENSLAGAVSVSHYLIGTEQAYHLAVLALIETHPDSQRLGQALERLFAEHAPGTTEAKSEAFAQAVVDAQNLIRVANVANVANRESNRN